MSELVEFRSLGETLRGRLSLPATESRPVPLVIMAHGFSATINGMVAERYADAFIAAGFATLLYDHYSFGISDGRPRQQFNPWIQARGYLDAIDFVATLPNIDRNRVAIWGDSASGGQVLVVAAVDDRVAAVIAQVPGCGDEPPPEDTSQALFNDIHDILRDGHLASLPKIVGEAMPVVSADQLGTPSCLTPITAFRWFIEYGGRHQTNWVNQARLVELETTALFEPGLCAAHVRAPLLMVIACQDEMPGANSDVARMAFDAAPQPKQILEIEGGHFGLLHYPSELFEQASSAQREFLLRTL